MPGQTVLTTPPIGIGTCTQRKYCRVEDSRINLNNLRIGILQSFVSLVSHVFIKNSNAGMIFLVLTDIYHIFFFSQSNKREVRKKDFHLYFILQHSNI